MENWRGSNESSTYRRGWPWWAAVLLVSFSTSARPKKAFFEEDAARAPDSATSEPAGTSSNGVSLVDIDGDGDLDAFIAQGTASLDVRPNVLWVNDGDGFFTDESSARLPQGADANSVKADFADVDEDGDLDAIVANLGPEQLLVNDGHGTFTDGSAQLPAPPDLFSDISANARFADVTGDDCADILVANENPFDPSPDRGAQNRLWVNDCTGTFQDETAERLPALTDQTAATLTGDIDDDGDADILVLNRGQELVYVNDGTGHFTDETTTRFPVTSDSTRGGALADLNGDGTLDLVTSNSRGEPPRVYWNTGGGIFTEGRFDFTPTPEQTDTELQLVDLNGDRYPDVYVANAGRFDSGHGFEGGPDHLFENKKRRFVEVTAKHAMFPANQASTAAAFGDLDGDGDADLVVAATGDGELGRERVFINDGPRRQRCHPRRR